MVRFGKILLVVAILSHFVWKGHFITDLLLFWGLVLILLKPILKIHNDELKKYPESELIDVGPETNYYKLSYRRKALRNLYISVFLFVVGLLVAMLSLRVSCYIFSFSVLFFVNFIYNLKQNKK